MTEAEAEQGYIAWKGWTDGFAAMSRGDADYFDRELHEAGRLTKIRDVLEIGFGNGKFLAYCRSRGWSVTGTEMLPELVQRAKGAGFDAVTADEQDSLPDASFDLVVAFDLLEHIPPEHTIPFLSSLASKVRPGGAIVLRFPNADSWLGNFAQHGDVTHVNAIGVVKMQYYAQGSGLRIVRFRATRRRGFKTSMIHGVHRLTAAPLGAVIGWFARAIYLPGLPVVFSTPNVVCVLTPGVQPTAMQV
jgi:SAM-dependent methyltransferase